VVYGRWRHQCVWGVARLKLGHEGDNYKANSSSPIDCVLRGLGVETLVFFSRKNQRSSLVGHHWGTCGSVRSHGHAAPSISPLSPKDRQLKLTWYQSFAGSKLSHMLID